MFPKSLSIALLTYSGLGTIAQADVIHVPADQPTLQAGIDAASNGDEIIVADGVYTGAGNRDLSFQGKSILLRSANGSQDCVIDCQSAGRAFIFNSGETQDAVLEGMTMRNGLADLGGAISIVASGPTIANCRLKNSAADVGGAMEIADNSSPMLNNCIFTDNAAFAGGAIAISESSPVFLNCRFSGNEAVAGGALMTVDSTAKAVNCDFDQQQATEVGGAIVDFAQSTWINCAFRQNESQVAGAMFIASDNTALVNCTFHDNMNAGVVVAGLKLDEPAPTLFNCIFWGNSPVQLTDDPLFQPGDPHVYYSNIQGGWTGSGSNNINADPLFVQSSTGDLRLSFGSPCVNAGNNIYLPSDQFDLDGDGITNEPLPLDLDGMDRIQDGVVDMGAYEGEYDLQPSAAHVENLDQGDFASLLPCGGDLDLLENPVVLLINVSGPDNQNFTVTCMNANLYPDAGGFSELGVTLQTESSLQDGQFLTRIFLPFDQEMLDGSDPLSLNPLWYEQSSGNWRLAVSNNTQDSPGYDGPIGDRIAVENAENDFGFTQHLGDYGVFWNPDLQKGVVWANTDHLGDYAFGASWCLAECAPDGGDGVIDVQDLESLLFAWSEGNDSSCDFDGNGNPGIVDLLAVIAHWGQCLAPIGASAPPTAPPASGGPCPRPGLCIADINDDDFIDVADIATLLASWGDCTRCAADLNRDGKVNQRDLQIMRRMSLVLSR